jgi:hypothetical protein
MDTQQWIGSKLGRLSWHTMLRRLQLALIVGGSCACPLPLRAEEATPKPGQFAPLETAKYLSGELVVIDPINRRGGLRIDGDGGNRYHNGPLHYFALLPYAEVRSHGAPAELRDIPLGTHVHGYFHLPPAGQEQTIPPLPAEQKAYEIKQNHALTLEDDFSYYQRRGQSWKIVSIDTTKGKLNVAPFGELVKDGIHEAYTFDIDSTARIWKDRALVDLDQVTAGQNVQLNLTWAIGARDKEFGVADLWLDEASRQSTTELQRRRHVRFEQQRWVPGWIDHIEHFDYGGAEITITLFGGMDPSLYEDLKATQATGFWVATAENTLRTWAHRSDRKVGKVLDWKEAKNPPVGSSGIQLRLKFAEVLEGYRPGRCVRVKCERWAFVTMPPEERVKSLDDLKRSATLNLP